MLEPPGVGRGRVQQGLGLAGTLRRRQGAAGPKLPHGDANELNSQEERTRKCRPVPRDQVPGRPAATGVELDLGHPPGLVVVLNVIAAPRPVGHGLADLIAREVGLVGRQADDREQVSAQIHDGVEVAPVASLGQESGPPAAELGNLAHVAEGPEPEDARGVPLPMHAGAVLAEDVAGPIAMGVCLFPIPFEVERGAVGQGGHAERVGIIDLPGELVGSRQQAGRSMSAVRSPSVAAVGRLHRQRAGDPRALAGAEGQQQAPRLKVGPADRVDDAQAGRGRPADVDSGQFGRGDLARVCAAGSRARGASAACAATG